MSYRVEKIVMAAMIAAFTLAIGVPVAALAARSLWYTLLHTAMGVI